MMVQQTDRVTANWQDGQSMDMLVEGRKIALLIIMQTLFSKDAWDDLLRIWNPILKTLKFISPGAWIFWGKIPRFGFGKSFRVIDDYLVGIIDERRKMANTIYCNI